MTIYVDPIVATSTFEIGISDDSANDLNSMSDGRPLVIDYFSSRHGALSVGDIRVGFPRGQFEPRYVEISPICGIRVLVERDLLPLIARGATLCRRGRPLGRRLSVLLPRPEDWIDFLEHHPRHR